jgi:hypothetical protein
VCSSDLFTAYPFYYDWRQDVTKNAELLNNLINSSGLSAGEKVDIVGHSMGGLIGESYLQSQSGGKAAKFLAVGTPNQGSALAYPAVVNREVWFKNIGDRIGATLFIKHCGVPASLKNLLPVYNYLKDIGAKQPKDVSGMKTKNTLSSLLPLNFPSGFWGVKVGTLIGTGFPTLNIIDVTKGPHWPDGKPVREEYTNNGDGTVLAASAQIPGTDASNSITINQSHSGIIASSEGYSDILTFLGTPTTDDPGIYVDHKSALIIVGYPGSFTVTDENNNKTDSENGMVAIMDPADGNYQLQIDPTLTSTTFIVSQFLPNGQTEYKEYKFRGSNQEPKVIEYNSKHPNENPLHETREYKNPHFPKFWFYFWKFWNKFHK